MASIVESAPPTVSRHEAFVERQLSQARRRIRAIDLIAAGLVLLLGTLFYALGMVLADRWLDLSAAARQASFVAYLAAGGAFAFFALVRPLRRDINPYYAAKQVEQTLPEAKNSLVNWLDLRDDPLPPAIRNAVGLRAAKELGKADLSQAVQGRRLTWLGGAVAVLFVALFVAFVVLRPGPFFSRLARAFAPFGDGAVATQTRLTLVQPEGGDAILPVNQSLFVTVHVEGRVPAEHQPDALKLRYRYQQSDPSYQERALEPGQNGREWTTRLPALQLQTGLWYKVTGGDAETLEYRVQVRANPLLTGFEVTYTPRPYLGQAPYTATSPSLEGYRGTDVILKARTNRQVRDGRLHIDGTAAPVIGERMPGEPDALLFKLRLEKSGNYRIGFTSTEGETNGDPIPYPIKVLLDLPPQVELTKPEQDAVELPVNGTLTVEGFASDDFGLDQVRLHIRPKGGSPLAPILYRGKKTFRMESGAYPRRLEYREVVELEKLSKADGAPAVFAAGTELECWLEATDNCDYPGPQTSRSKRTLLVKMTPPATNPQQQQQQQQQRNQAKQEKQKHDAKQDEKLKQENEAAKQQDQKNQGQQSNDPQADPKQQEEQKNLEKEADDIRKKLEQEQARQPGEAKNGDTQPQPPSPNDPPKSEPKPEPQPNPGPKAEDKGEGQQKAGGGNAGEGKPEGNPEPQPQRADEKPQGQQNPGGSGKEGDPKQPPTDPKSGGDGKKPGQSEPMKNPDPMGSGQDPKNPNKGANPGKPGEEKGPGKQPEKPKPQPGGENPKPNDPQQGAGEQAGQPKSDGSPKPGAPKEQGGQPGASGERQPGQQKPEKSPPPKGDPKGGKPEDQKGNAGTPKAGPKEGKPEQAPGQEKSAKPDDPKAGGEGSKGQPKEAPKPGGSGDEPKPGDKGDKATPEQARDLAKQLQNGDAKAKQDAAKKLDDIRQNAKNPEARKAAEDALKQAGLDPQAGKPGETGDTKPAPKPEQPGQPGAGGKPSGTKPPPKAEEKSAGAPKPEGQGGDQPKGGEKPAGKPPTPQADPAQTKAPPPKGGDPSEKKAPGKGGEKSGGEAKDPKTPGGAEASAANKPGGPPPNPNDPADPAQRAEGKPGPDAQVRGEGKPKEPTKRPIGGDATGGLGGGDREKVPGTGPDAEKGTHVAADAEFRKKSGELLLKKFKDLPPEKLKEMGFTEEQRQAFLKSYAEMLKRQTAMAAGDKTGLRPGDRTGPSAANTTGPRRVTPGASGQPGDVERGGALLPPPELREGYREFTQGSDKK